MSPPARILAATDLSAPARHAVDRGFLLAASVGASYRVVHALELDAIKRLSGWLGEGEAQVRQQIVQRASAALQQQIADSAHRQGIAAEARVISGPPLNVILAELADYSADLLVIGARGDAFLHHLLPGSTASRLLRKSTGRPLLVVKQPPHENYRRLLVAVDFSPSALLTLRAARRLAPGAALVLLHAVTVPFDGKLAFAGVDEAVIDAYRAAALADGKRQIAALAEAAGLGPDDYLALVREGDPAQMVLVEEQDCDCDLVVVGKHGFSVGEELLLGSVTKHVLAEAQGDVLVVADGLQKNTDHATLVVPPVVA